MSERTDDTTEQDNSSCSEKKRKPGSYYYDDSTGYEIYDPAKDDEDENEDDGDESIQAGYKLTAQTKGGRFLKRSPF